MASSLTPGRWRLLAALKGQTRRAKRVTTAMPWPVFTIVCEMYRAEGGKGAEPLLKMSWNWLSSRMNRIRKK